MELSKQVQDIRTNWLISDTKRDEGLTTPEDIRRFDNISYGPYGDENLLDIYVQKSVSKPQATIVNIHGGGWVYGSKEIYQFYCMSLAQHGFTVVNINYRLAPESRFPSPLIDVNQVLTFLENHGKEYYVDTENLILVGDSAGAQITSHYAAIFTNPEFHALFDFKLPHVQIKALGLNCGKYEGKNIAEEGLDTVFFEYIDSIDKEPSKEVLNMLDTPKYITEKFPPSFIMSCQNDFLLGNAEPMHKLLSDRGVYSEIKIYGTKEQKDIAHVFHINIKLKEATQCNDDECEFFHKFV